MGDMSMKYGVNLSARARCSRMCRGGSDIFDFGPNQTRKNEDAGAVKAYGRHQSAQFDSQGGINVMNKPNFKFSINCVSIFQSLSRGNGTKQKPSQQSPGISRLRVDARIRIYA